MNEPKPSLLLVMETRFFSGAIHREPMTVFPKEAEMQARQRAQAITDELKRMQVREVMQALGIASVGVGIQVVPFIDGSRIQVATEMPTLVTP